MELDAKLGLWALTCFLPLASGRLVLTKVLFEVRACLAVLLWNSGLACTAGGCMDCRIGLLLEVWNTDIWR